MGAGGAADRASARPAPSPSLVIHSRTHEQTNGGEGNKLPPVLEETIRHKLDFGSARVCASCCILSRKQSVTWGAEHVHSHTPHTRLESDSLVRCCHGNPIKGDTQATLVKSARLSAPLRLVPSDTPSSSSAASRLCSSPSVALLASPLAQLSALLSSLPSYLFILSPSPTLIVFIFWTFNRFHPQVLTALSLLSRAAIWTRNTFVVETAPFQLWERFTRGIRQLWRTALIRALCFPFEEDGLTFSRNKDGRGKEMAT